MKSKIALADRSRTPEYNIRWAAGSHILESLGFQLLPANEELVQELGKTFSTDFLSYWTIPLSALEPFQMGDFSLEKLLRIIQADAKVLAKSPNP